MNEFRRPEILPKLVGFENVGLIAGCFNGDQIGHGCVAFGNHEPLIYPPLGQSYTLARVGIHPPFNFFAGLSAWGRVGELLVGAVVHRTGVQRTTKSLHDSRFDT